MSIKSFSTQVVLADVKSVSVNSKKSRDEVARQFFKEFISRTPFGILLSLVSLGYYRHAKYKQAQRIVGQAIFARKIFYLKLLHKQIDATRKTLSNPDPRKAINSIFMHVQSVRVDDDDNALEFKSVYHSKEILLFITNPIRNFNAHYIPKIKRGLVSPEKDYVKIWNDIKKKSLVNQYRQIKRVNDICRSLKEDYQLTSEGIQDRLLRTTSSHGAEEGLTTLKGLRRAFEEIMVAYDGLEDLKDEQVQLFSLLDTIRHTSQKDIDTIRRYLDSPCIPNNLPIVNRRQIVRLGSYQKLLKNLEDDKKFSSYNLVLHKYQWDFLASLQDVSNITSGLFNWAFTESSTIINNRAHVNFANKLKKRTKISVLDDGNSALKFQPYFDTHPKVKAMTLDFAEELNREWPAIDMYNSSGLIYSTGSSEALTIDKLCEVYDAIEKFADGDNELCAILQESLSHMGKQSFQLDIEDSVVQLLGEKPEYSFPILSNCHINAKRLSADRVDVCYHFEQVIMGENGASSKGATTVVIVQPLVEKNGEWSSLDTDINLQAE